MPARWIAAAAVVLAPLLGGAPALADHGGPLRSAPMSPIAVALLAGGVTLAVGLVVVALVTLLARGERGGDGAPETPIAGDPEAAPRSE
jgi:hypothetical protein